MLFRNGVDRVHVSGVAVKVHRHNALGRWRDRCLDPIGGEVPGVRLDICEDRYGIVMQDTFVQVDAEGEEITKWNSGGAGVSSLLSNIKSV